jgi:YD repeat-containing protein
LETVRFGAESKLQENTKMHYKRILLIALVIVMSMCTVASHAETVTYTYDTMGRLIQAIYGDGTVVQYIYDKRGNRLQKSVLPGSSSCTISLSQSARTFSSTGGTGSVSVTASSGSCSWHASVHPGSSGWLTVTSGSNGTGSGMLNYSAAANSSCASRVGTMAIAGHTFTVAQSGTCEVTVGRTGGGNGMVTSTPAGINCGTQCTASFESGSAVTLTAAAPAGSIFKNWTGCDVTTGIFCNLTIGSAREVAADFAACANPPVTAHPQQGTDGPFASIGLAVQAYTNEDQVSLIKVQAVNLTEDLSLGRAWTYTVKGGYDCEFLNSWPATLISGLAAISHGSVSMENIVLSGSITITGSGSLTAQKLMVK